MGKVRVMIVDDSAVIRGLTKRMLESNDNIEVVASIPDGEVAVRAIKKTEVDVIVLDIEMPRMDGITALPLLIAARPNVKIVMSSTLTTKNAEISLKALELGAADYVPKPTTAVEIHSGENFRDSLIGIVLALGESAQRARRKGLECQTKRQPFYGKAGAVKSATKTPDSIALRPPGRFAPEILAIGSSTGGPQALFEFFRALEPSWTLPIVITQHMPATFTKLLANHLTSISSRPCIEAQDGEAVTDGHVYIAPGDNHMLIELKGTRIVTRLTQTPPENFCRPAVDPMMRSLVKVYGPKILALILTGMGKDGLAGCENVVAAGGTVVAQDEDTSVVWGMPAAVAQQGLCSAVLPLGEIAPHISNFKSRTAA